MSYIYSKSVLNSTRKVQEKLKIGHRYMRMKRVCDLAHRVLEGFGKSRQVFSATFDVLCTSMTIMHFDDTNATFDVLCTLMTIMHFDDTNATFDVLGTSCTLMILMLLSMFYAL